MAKRNPASSRAIAVVTVAESSPALASFRYWPHNRTWAFHAVSRIGWGRPKSRMNAGPETGSAPKRRKTLARTGADRVAVHHSCGLNSIYLQYTDLLRVRGNTNSFPRMVGFRKTSVRLRGYSLRDSFFIIVLIMYDKIVIIALTSFQ